jgi:hypothetical protein
MAFNLDSVRQLIVTTVTNSKNQLVDILNKTGISTSVHDNANKIYKNTVNALSLSNDFRNRLANLIVQLHLPTVQQVMKNKSNASGTLGFVTQPVYWHTLSIDDGSCSPNVNGEFVYAQTYTDGNFATQIAGNPDYNNSANTQDLTNKLSSALNNYSAVAQTQPSAEVSTLSQIHSSTTQSNSLSKFSNTQILMGALAIGVVILLLTSKED